jgi:hypothetical protein
MMSASRRGFLTGASWRVCNTNSPSRECLFVMLSPFSSLHHSVDPSLSTELSPTRYLSSPIGPLQSGRGQREVAGERTPPATLNSLRFIPG